MKLLSEINKKKYSSIAEEIETEYPKIIKEMGEAIGRVQNYGKKPEPPKSDIEIIKQQLESRLKSMASDVVYYNKKLTDKERKQKLKTIEEFTNYIRDYEKNKEIINSFRDFEEQSLDDGR